MEPLQCCASTDLPQHLRQHHVRPAALWRAQRLLRGTGSPPDAAGGGCERHCNSGGKVDPPSGPLHRPAQLRLWPSGCDRVYFPMAAGKALQRLPIEGLVLQGVVPAYEPAPPPPEDGPRGPHDISYLLSKLIPTPVYQADGSLDWLSSLTGLRELMLHGLSHQQAKGVPAMLKPLCSLSMLNISSTSTSQELMWAFLDDPDEDDVWELTQLQHLEVENLPCKRSSTCSDLSALTHLWLSGGSSVLWPPADPPADSGSWLPHLRVLTLGATSRAYSLPASCTQLTNLGVTVTSLSLLGQLQQSTSLRELSLRLPATLELGASINGMSSLEVPHVTRWAGTPGEDVGWRGVQLEALARLRSLSLYGGCSTGIAAALASAAGCARLTQVQAVAWPPVLEQAEAQQLYGVGRVGQLRDLHLTHNVFSCPAQLGAWLGQQEQLTRLQLVGTVPLASTAALEVLPTGLLELQFSAGLQLPEVPGCLVRLGQLQKLSLRAPAVQQLPEWLSQLQRLEWLSISGTRVVTPQPVLGQLPLLRQVVLPCQADRDVVLRDVPHLRLRVQPYGDESM